MSTALGYSMIDIENSDGMNADAFKKGQYIVGNLMFYPVKNAMMGIEFQWGDRENFKSVESAGHVGHPYARRDEYFDIYLCRGLKANLKDAWPGMKVFD